MNILRSIARASRFDTAFANGTIRAIDKSSQELYERWSLVARDRRSALALVGESGTRWTFSDLWAAGERAPAPPQPIVFPRGHGIEFIVTLLRAWRSGAIVCPLELAQPEPIVPAPLNCAHLKLTSGSTGAVKCVAFTAAQLAADARNIVSTMGLRREWPNLAAISLAHSYGFSNLVLPLLLHGIPLIILPAPLPEVLLNGARAFDSVTLAAVPALWRTWEAADAIPKNVKLAISAGAPLPLDLERAIFERHALKIHNFYGSSECGGIAYDRSETPRTDGTIAGSALDHVQLSLTQRGILLVQGEAVGIGYWPEPAPELGLGSFQTSDLVTLHDGLVYLRGRISDLINVAGRKVAPEQIELALRQHPDVRECVVFGIPDSDSDRFETIAAAVLSPRPLPIAELNTFLSRLVPAWQIPRQWWFTDELAPNARGKFSRREWRGKYLDLMLNKSS